MPGMEQQLDLSSRGKKLDDRPMSERPPLVLIRQFLGTRAGCERGHGAGDGPARGIAAARKVVVRLRSVVLG